MDDLELRQPPGTASSRVSDHSLTIASQTIIQVQMILKRPPWLRGEAIAETQRKFISLA